MTKWVLWAKSHYLKFRICKAHIVKFCSQNSQNRINNSSVWHTSNVLMYLKWVFKKIADKINLIRKPSKVNTASRATLAPIGIAPPNLNIKEQNFTHNFIVCTKLKQHLVLGLDFAQKYKLVIDWEINEKLFLRCKGKKIATSLKDHWLWTTDNSFIKNFNRWEQWEQKTDLITSTTVIIPPPHISYSIKAINQAIYTKLPSEALTRK